MRAAGAELDSRESEQARHQEAAQVRGERPCDFLVGEHLARVVCGCDRDRAAEIKTDLGTLEDIMTTANIAQSAVKDALARTGAALGSLKPNGRVRTRSPLSDVIELETMLAGVTAKAALWTTLKALRLRTPVDFDELGARANKQSATLSRWRDAAAENAFSRETNEPASQPPAR